MDSVVEVSAAARKEKLLDQNLANVGRETRLLVEHTLLDASVGVDAAVAEEGPMGAMFIHALPFNVGEDGFFSIDARLGENLAARRDDEALAPEFDPIAHRPALRDRRD